MLKMLIGLLAIYNFPSADELSDIYNAETEHNLWVLYSFCLAKKADIYIVFVFSKENILHQSCETIAIADVHSIKRRHAIKNRKL